MHTTVPYNPVITGITVDRVAFSDVTAPYIGLAGLAM